MEEIKVGEYVRWKSGSIRKVTRLLTSKMLKKMITKHSPNIIDLIQKDDVGIMNCYGLLVKKFITESDILELKLGNYKLLKIVTKEQFEAAEYEVEE